MTAQPPNATTDTYSLDAGQTLVVDLTHSILSNDLGPDGATLTAALARNSGPTHGSLLLNADGTFTYTPFAGFAGSDSFSYMASNGASASTPTKVSLQVAPVTDSQYLDYGNTAMRVPMSSAKTYWGGDGGQTLTGSTGSDVFNIYWNDTSKDTVVETQAGVSTVNANLYTSTAFTLSDNIKNVTVTGNGVNVVGNALGNLMVDGGTGAVTLDGGAGNDVLVGGAGADTFIEQTGAGHDVIYNFDLGKDVLRLSNFTSFAAVKSAMTQNGNDVVITLNASDSVTLRNTTVGQLGASNFQIGLNTASLTKTFDDEFNNFTWSADGSKGWMTTYPHQGIDARTISSSHDAEYDSDASVGVDPFTNSNGVLTITAAPGTPGVTTPAGSGLTYTSGQITTYKSFQQLYGYFEVSAQLPSGQGFWPGFWMLPADNSWPPELDFMEQLSKDPNTIYQTAHTNDGGFNSRKTTVTSVANATSTFHTYGVDWEADTITWYIDGTAVGKTATPSDMHKPMYMLLGLGAGGAGSWAGAADGTSSAQLKIDYVRAYAPTEVHAPTTAADTYTGAAGKTLSVAAAKGVLANDLDQNAQTLTATLAPNGGPAHGTLTLSKDGSFTYAPTAGYAGTDSFTYIASDGASASAPTTVKLATAAAALNVRSDVRTMVAGQSAKIAASNGVLSNDSDPNGLALTATLAPGGGPTHGTLALGKDGSYTYTPTLGFAGSDSFSYVASDGMVTSAPTSVAITVQSIAPTTLVDSYAARAGQTLSVNSSSGLLHNDGDHNGLALSAALAANGGPKHGTLALSGDGSFTYQAAAGFAGTDSFTYLAKDSLDVSTPTTVAVAVSSYAPIVHSANYRDNTSQTLTVGASNGVLSTATDQNGLKLTAAVASNGGPSHGTVNLSQDGSFVYTPTAGFIGYDSFNYVASDSLNASVAATVTLRVVNNAFST